ncbi:Putative multidrug export ATP-binding/permease protein [Paenibacillus plantiphilus]|uniref:Multidrug export ATP-binding/permease protein n=1 Tax=Paenibacillus plantiphilus TaxID=2905650 RepID=A0ABN8G883_9BACL|nr:ABC transporter ATP-binding protein [Paenibacillus plantiphilus]CAH1202650.1 Putative multidrug export ATP-binding/permease protein [Paenibacillus plantiphilus]
MIGERLHLRNSLAELRRMLALLGPRRKVYFAGLIGDSMVHGSITIVMAFVFKNLLDFSVGGDQQQLLGSIMLVSAAFLAIALISPIFAFMYMRVVKRTMVDLRARLYDHLGVLPPSYFESRHSGDLISRSTNDVQAMENIYTEHLKSMLTDLFTLLGSIVSMYILDWRFAIALTIFGALGIGVNLAFAGPLRRTGDKLQQRMGQMTERLTDVLAGLQTMKMFRLQKIVTGKYDEANEGVTASTVEQGHRSGLLEAVNYCINFISFGGILVVGIMMFAQGYLGLGQMAAIVQLEMGVTMIFLQLGSIVSLMQGSLAGAARVFEVLDHAPEAERFLPRGEEASLSRNVMLEFKEVGFSYEPDSQVLNDFSLTIKSGEVAALVGASGSGKSTIFKLLLGFYSPTCGAVGIAGKPISHYTMEELRGMIAYVPQDAYLFEGTIEENILLGKEGATREEMIAASQAAYAHEFIEALPEGYATMVGERGAKLSGGQRQRVAIARALLKNAPILLLDEATSALDNESEYWVQQALNKLMKDRTVLVIAHRLSTIEEAEMIYVLEQGKVVEQGSHDQLIIQDGVYASLHDYQLSREKEHTGEFTRGFMNDSTKESAKEFTKESAKEFTVV